MFAMFTFKQLYLPRVLLLLLLLPLLVLPLFAQVFPSPRSLGATYAYAHPSTQAVSAVSGSTLFWQTLLMAKDLHSVTEFGIMRFFEADLQNAAGPYVKVNVKNLTVNASALFIWYDYDVFSGEKMTPMQMERRLMGSHLSISEAAVAALIAKTPLSEVRQLLPTTVTLIRPLVYDPNAPNLTQIVVSESVMYSVRMLLTGEPASWAIVLEQSSAELFDAIEQAIGALTDSRRLICTPIVKSATVVPADPKRRTIGDGSGGLLVSIVAQCGGTKAMTGRFLDTVEYASWLLSINTTNITAVFQNSSSSLSTVRVATTTAGGSVKTFSCNSLCRGVAALGFFSLGLILVVVVTTALFYFVHFVPPGPVQAELPQKSPK